MVLLSSHTILTFSRIMKSSKRSARSQAGNSSEVQVSVENALTDQGSCGRSDSRRASPSSEEFFSPLENFSGENTDSSAETAAAGNSVENGFVGAQSMAFPHASNSISGGRVVNKRSSARPQSLPAISDGELVDFWNLITPPSPFEVIDPQQATGGLLDRCSTRGCNCFTRVRFPSQWRQNNPEWSHYFSRNRRDLGETTGENLIEASELVPLLGTTADSLDTTLVGRLSKLLKANLVFPQARHSLCRILRDTFLMAVVLFALEFMYLYGFSGHTNLRFYPDFLFPTTITVAEFLKKNLAYLRPGHPNIWFDLVLIINTAMVVLTCVSVALNSHKNH